MNGVSLNLDNAKAASFGKDAPTSFHPLHDSRSATSKQTKLLQPTISRASPDNFLIVIAVDLDYMYETNGKPQKYKTLRFICNLKCASIPFTAEQVRSERRRRCSPVTNAMAYTVRNPKDNDVEISYATLVMHLKLV